jgi:hypothetical protein
MAMQKMTYPMLQREAVRLACIVGLEHDYSHDAIEKFKFSYDVSNDKEHLFYKDKEAIFSPSNLYMSIDDFARTIICPFLLSCLTNDLKFIHLECT